MIKKICFKLLSFGFLLFIWMSFDVRFFDGMAEKYVFIVIYLLSAAIMFTMKKEWLKILSVLLLTVGACIYDIDYLTMVLPVVSLTFVLSNGIFYSRTGDKKHYENMQTYINVSNLIITFHAVCVIFAVINADSFSGYYFRENMKMVLVFAAFFMILVIQTKGEKKKDTGAYRTLYIESIIVTVLLIANYTFHKDLAHMQMAKESALFIFIFVLIMFACEDPFVMRLIEKTEKKFYKTA